MKLPRSNLAVISDSKLREYLLSDTHPVGRTKARVFRRFGYSAESWEILAADLRKVVLQNEINASVGTKFGARIVVDGVLKTPSGRDFPVRTAWFVDFENRIPHFVTAYPR